MKTSHGPAKSMRLNLGWRTKRTSRGSFSSTTAEVLCALILPAVNCRWGSEYQAGRLLCNVNW